MASLPNHTIGTLAHLTNKLIFFIYHKLLIQHWESLIACHLVFFFRLQRKKKKERVSAKKKLSTLKYRTDEVKRNRHHLSFVSLLMNLYSTPLSLFSLGEPDSDRLGPSMDFLQLYMCFVNTPLGFK